MTDVLDRIADVVLDHDTSAARAWIEERIEKDMLPFRPYTYAGPIFTIRTDEWQASPVYTSKWWHEGEDAYAWSPKDADPLATYAHLDPWGEIRRARYVDHP